MSRLYLNGRRFLLQTTVILATNKRGQGDKKGDDTKFTEMSFRQQAIHLGSFRHHDVIMVLLITVICGMNGLVLLICSQSTAANQLLWAGVMQ